MPSKKLRDEISIPLVVDVDGSLVNGDLLIEGTLRLLATTPFKLFSLPFWLAKGRAALKRRVAQAVSLPPETLVLNPAVLEEIAAAKAAGRQVWLASAADELAVAPLTEHLGTTGHLTSNGHTNLVGETKAATLVRRFGAGGFDYIGNEWRDLAVWKQARRAIGVNLSARLARKVRRVDTEARFLSSLDRRPLDYLRALRPHQWSKNVLVFVPLIAAHEIQASLYLVAAGLFVALSAVASGTYLLNDLLDLPHDRRHERKRHRPLAAGTVPLLPMVGLSLVLAVGGPRTGLESVCIGGGVHPALPARHARLLPVSSSTKPFSMSSRWRSSLRFACWLVRRSSILNCHRGFWPSSPSSFSLWPSSNAKASCAHSRRPAGLPSVAEPM